MEETDYNINLQVGSQQITEENLAQNYLPHEQTPY